jgi:polyhydroxybutyrate depolymerase
VDTARRRIATEWIVGWAVAVLLVAAVVVVIVLMGRDDGGPATPTRAGGTDTLAVGDRPVTVHLPPAYDGEKSLPLVVLLHGYTASGDLQERYFRLTPEADRRGFIYVHPDGTTDSRKNRFWNATDACCDLYGAGVDDSAYLRLMIDTIRARYRVDARRIYLIGHSNGAFMSFRMACDHAGTVAAIATLNGATWNDIGRCKPSFPVSVLAIHGTADRTIAFAGGGLAQRVYPSAERTAADWASLNGCGGPAVEAPAIDVIEDLPGAETVVRDVASTCRGDAMVRTWTITDGVHTPNLGPAFTPSVLDFLLARSKP